jgi:SAM-dependent methyltransferase
VWERALTAAGRDRHPGRSADGLALPPAALRVRVIAQADPEVFLDSGRAEAATLAAAASDHGLPVDAAGRLLDFGCGCGRVTRHWHALPSVEVHGTDHDADLIDWMRSGLPFIKAARNDLAPPLGYPADHFGIVYAISVFTHMTNNLARAWMVELARVIRPGGLLLFSALDQRQVDRLRPHERRAIHRGEPVVQFVDALGTNMCVAYHPRTFIERITPGFDILSTRVIGAQELYVLRLRSRAEQPG